MNDFIETSFEWPHTWLLVCMRGRRGEIDQQLHVHAFPQTMPDMYLWEACLTKLYLCFYLYH